MSRRLLALNLLLALGVAAGASLAYFGLRSAGSTAGQVPRTVTAQRGVVLSSVSATGNVKTPDQLNLNFQTGGRLVELDAKPGRRVRKGQVVARIDPTSAQLAVQNAAASLRSAEAGLQQKIDGETQAQRAQDALSVEQARMTLANAKAALPQTKATNAASLASSTLSLAQASAQLARDRAQLAKDGAALATDEQAVTQAQSDYDAATNQVNTAKQQLANDQAGLSGAQTKQTSDQGASSQHAQQLSKDQAALSQAKSDLAAAQGALQQAQSKLQQDQAACSASPASPSCGDIAADQAAVTAAQAAVVPAQAAVNAAQAAVNADQSQSSSDTSTATSDSLAVAAANRAVSADQSALNDAQSNQQTAKATLTTAQNAVTADQNTVAGDQTKILGDENAVATQKLGARSTSVKNVQSVAAAKQAIAGARIGVRSAVLARTVKEAPLLPGDLAAARAAVVSAQANLATAEQALADTVLRAPLGGTVAAVSGLVGETVGGGGISSGAASSSSSSGSGSSPLVTLVDLGQLQVSAGFSETDVAKIRLGQTATVTLDALPAEQLAAHVVAIDTLSTVVSNVVTYNVTFALDRSAAGAKPGMSASVDVVTSERDNAINVPTSAVSSLAGASTVTVLRAGKQVRVPVVTGLTGDSSTEILSGLSAGAQVVLPTATFAGGTSGTGTTGGGRGGGFGAFGGGQLVVRGGG